MRKSKLEYIEAFIYAKTLNILCENYSVKNPNTNLFVLKSKVASNKLLNLCENKLLKHKLKNYSYLNLKQELERVNEPNNMQTNLCKIKQMLTKYDYYFNIVK